MMASNCYLYVLSILSISYLTYGDDYKGSSGSSNEEKDDSNIYVYPAGFKGGRYYYGGIYRGTCHNDGLYYRGEDSFVICSNGNAYIQPCAPGTRSSGQHRYSPGYYYGYSDFCDINLVDQGYGPAHYAPYGVPTYSDDEDGYNTNLKSTSYGTDQDGYQKEPNSRYGEYQAADGYGSYGANQGTPTNYDGNKNYYNQKQNGYGKDPYGNDGYRKESYGKDPYGKGHSGYAGRDTYEKKETAYDPNTKY